MPEFDLAKALDQGIEKLSLSVSANQRAALLAYAALLEQWGKAFNLTAIEPGSDTVSLHLLDCLAIVAPMRRALAEAFGAETPLAFLDIGSGAGLPGAVLAIMNPQWQVHSIDSVQKKIAFQQQFRAVLRLNNFHPVHDRVESWVPPKGQKFHAITARAFSEMNKLIELSKRLLMPYGLYLPMLGKWEQALEEALPAGWAIGKVEAIAVPGLAAQRHIAVVALATHKPEGA